LIPKQSNRDHQSGSRRASAGRLPAASKTSSQKTKSGEPTAARKNYRAQLLVERITGQQAERFKTAAMDWGTETEELAATTYTLRSGNIVDKVGFKTHPFIEAGASPDGEVKGDSVGLAGGIEIKCYNTANHIQALRDNAMPKEHTAQVQGQMWIWGYPWVDFISFEPTLPSNAQIFIQRIYRDEAYIKMLELEVALFMDEVLDDIEFVKNYKETH
jgi:predicted phage-related endonuclease